MVQDQHRYLAYENICFRHLSTHNRGENPPWSRLSATRFTPSDSEVSHWLAKRTWLSQGPPAWRVQSARDLGLISMKLKVVSP